MRYLLILFLGIILTSCDGSREKTLREKEIEKKVLACIDGKLTHDISQDALEIIRCNCLYMDKRDHDDESLGTCYKYGFPTNY